MWSVGSDTIYGVTHSAHQLRRRVDALAGSFHDGAPDNDAIGDPRDIARLLWRGDAKAHADRERGCLPQALDGPWKFLRQVRASARDAKSADQIDEASPVLGDGRHAFLRRRRRDKPD